MVGVGPSSLSARCRRSRRVLPGRGPPPPERVDKPTDQTDNLYVDASPVVAAVIVLLAAPVWITLYELPLRQPAVLAVLSIAVSLVFRTIFFVVLLRVAQPEEWGTGAEQLWRETFFLGGTLGVLIGQIDADGD